MTNSKSKKEFISYEGAYGRPIEDMMRRVPSLERIKETVGWVPQRSLTESLQLIVESFDKAKK
jgi:nucleoside-diphosphate-sugar epimerase